MDNLYNMRYRYEPEKYKNANYEKFLDRTIRKREEAGDPSEFQMDEFAKSICFIKSEGKDLIDSD